jgi:hypothetical protein
MVPELRAGGEGVVRKLMNKAFNLLGVVFVMLGLAMIHPGLVFLVCGFEILWQDLKKEVS